MSDLKQRGRRKEKTPEASRLRAQRLLEGSHLNEPQRRELLSLLCEHFCNGVTTRSELEARIGKSFPGSLANLFRGENLWDLLRFAAQEGLFVHQAPLEYRLATELFQRQDWLRHHTTVVETASPDALADRAAEKLLELIREAAPLSPDRTVHVGCAGGWTMRAIALKLSARLREDHAANPQTLVFHAMVAGFDEDDFQVDPNSFIHSLVDGGLSVKIRFLRMPMPGIVTREEYLRLREMPSIRRTLQRASEIQIVVTSGSLLEDHTSTIRTFFNSLAESDPACSVDDLFTSYSDAGVIGDFLWQPLTEHGPADIDLPYRVATLMSLRDLQDFLARSPANRVLAVLGCSTMTRMPKSRLLGSLTRCPERLISDLVVDTPTLNGYLQPALLAQYMVAAERPPTSAR